MSPLRGSSSRKNVAARTPPETAQTKTAPRQGCEAFLDSSRPSPVVQDEASRMPAEGFVPGALPDTFILHPSSLFLRLLDEA
jgi:hypothetical protein